jgi:small subunit ribosomal protein S7e
MELAAASEWRAAVVARRPLCAPSQRAALSAPHLTHLPPPKNQALFDLEATNAELKADLRDLYITGAREIDVQGGSRKAVIVQVPFRLLKAFHKVQQRLVRELEKKFSGKDVVIVANRRILPPSSSGVSNARPRSRTLTAVHEAILGDLVFPTEIVGKRIRYRVDGSKLMKVFLDPKDRNTTEYKVDTFSGVYKKLTGKDVVFEYPVAEAAA